MDLTCEKDVIRIKRTEKEREKVKKEGRSETERVEGRGICGVEEGGRFQSGYIGIYITLLASIFESRACRAAGYNHTQLYFIIDGPGDACEFSSR